MGYQCLLNLNPHIKGKKNQQPESLPDGCNEHGNLVDLSQFHVVSPLQEMYLKIYRQDVVLLFLLFLKFIICIIQKA